MTEEDANVLKMEIEADDVGRRLQETRVVQDLGPSGRVESYSISATDPFTGAPYRIFNPKEWDVLRGALERAFSEADRRRQ